MEPNILQGQTVLASFLPFFFSKPKIGDIVLVRHSGKRSQVPSGTWRSASRISLPLDENERDSGVANAPQNDEEDKKYLVKRITKIDNRKYFVTGDNPNDSFDSRRFGWISKKDILGKVILKL